MLTKLRQDYERFKATHLLEQVLRVSNTLFATFTFWNLVFKPHAKLGLSWSTAPNPALLVVTLVVGVIFGALLFIKFTRKHHLLILPLVATSFSLTSHRPVLLGLLALPCSVTLTLLLAKAIIEIANRIRRR